MINLYSELTEKVSVFKCCKSKTVDETKSLDDIFNVIKTSGYIAGCRNLKEYTEIGRKLLNEGNAPAYKMFKESRMPAIMTNALFEKGRKSTDPHSFQEVQYVMFDIDKMEDVVLWLEDLHENPSKYDMFYAAYISLSGNGLHILVAVRGLTDENFKDCYKYIASEIEIHYHLSVDMICCDIARLCILSYDPNIFINEQAEVLDAQEIMNTLKMFELIPDEEKEILTQESKNKGLALYIEKMNIQMVEGSRHNTIVSAVHKLNRAGFDREAVKVELRQFVEPDFEEKEINSIVDSVYKNWKDQHGVNRKKWEKFKSSKAQKFTSASEEAEEDENELEDIIEFPDLTEDIPLLPVVFQSIGKFYFSKQERYIKLMSAIFALAAIPRCTVTIRNKLYSINLGLCVCGAPASGKSAMLAGIRYFEIHADRVLEESQLEVEQYKKDKKAWDECEEERKHALSSKRGQGKNAPQETTEEVEPCDCGEEPKEVSPKYILHQAKGSYVGMAEAMLHIGPFKVVIYTSELDDMNNRSSGDFCDLSTFIRKFMEGETISYTFKNRKVVVEDPKGSILFSGTDGQSVRYFKTSSNGEFSRFQHLTSYHQEYIPLSAGVSQQEGFSNNEKQIEGRIKTCSTYFEKYSFEILFTVEQLDRVDQALEPYRKEATLAADDEYLGNIYRDTNRFILMAAALSAFFACEENFVPDALHFAYPADNRAVEFVIRQIPFLMSQQKIALERLPIVRPKGEKRKIDKYLNVYNALPCTFTFNEGWEIAKEIKVDYKYPSCSTFKRLLKRWKKGKTIEHTAHGTYQKIECKDNTTSTENTEKDELLSF